MRILLTTDTQGGVWTFTRELALGLAARGHRIAVASLGGATAWATAEFAAPAAIEVFTSPLGLEWMPAARDDVPLARRWLAGIAARFRPDVLHANQFAFATAAPGVPTVLTVHSDVVSWWRAVHGAAPPAEPWHEWYRALALEALAAASAVVTPSRAAAEDLAASFGCDAPLAVIPNGIEPPAEVARRREPFALAAGRYWDAGKQLGLLERDDLPLPVRAAGPGAVAARSARLARLGPLSRRELQAEMARAAIFIGPSRYEPFGLAALEAAASGCALLLNDIASAREIWGDAASYFRRNDGEDLVRQLGQLARAPRPATERARIYSRAAMAARYAEAYAAAAVARRPVCEAA